jgi:osmotically inducible lipoprotein OsmB
MNTHTQTLPRGLALAAALVLALGLGACSNLSRQDQNTAVGAGVGAVGGAVLPGGSTLGTLGGAAIGGLIGNQVDTKK